MHTDVRIATAVVAVIAMMAGGAGCKKSNKAANVPANEPQQSWVDRVVDNTADTQPVPSFDITTTTAPYTDVYVPPVASQPAPTPTEYTVQTGDTLWDIAKKVLHDGTKYKQIIEANKDKDLTRPLRPGMVLTMPAVADVTTPPAVPGFAPVPPVVTPPSAYVSTGTVQHKVVSGETGTSIARKYFGDAGSSKLAAIRQANPGINLDKLSVGQVLTIPASTGLTTRSSSGDSGARSGSSSDVPHPGMRLR